MLHFGRKKYLRLSREQAQWILFQSRPRTTEVPRPWILITGCLECGGCWQRCSPEVVEHKPDCPGVARESAIEKELRAALNANPK